MTKEHPIFMLVHDDIRGDTPFFFKSNSCYPFPNRINVEKEYPEICLAVDTIESFFEEDLAVYLYSESTTPESLAYDLYSDEIIIATQKSAFTNDEEVLYYMITPLGIFYFYFILATETGRLVEQDLVYLSDEMRKFLFLAPCEVAFPVDGGGKAAMVHEYPAKMPFPPSLPQYYLDGSLLRKEAEIYYEYRRQKIELLEENDRQKNRNDEPVYSGISDWDIDDEDEDDFCQTQTVVFETTFYVIRPED